MTVTTPTSKVTNVASNAKQVIGTARLDEHDLEMGLSSGGSNVGHPSAVAQLQAQRLAQDFIGDDWLPD